MKNKREKLNKAYQQIKNFLVKNYNLDDYDLDSDKLHQLVEDIYNKNIEDKNLDSDEPTQNNLSKESKSKQKINHQYSDKLLRLIEVLDIIHVSKSTWWEGVKSGRFPKPIKLGPRTTCWRKSDIDKLVNGEIKY